MLKCYDTLRKEYREIETSLEIGTEVKRSYWREEHAERRYYARVSEFTDFVILPYSRNIEDSVILNDEIEILHECIKSLPKRSQQIIYLKYFCDMNDVAIGKAIGLSNSYVSRLVKQIKLNLKVEMLRRYDYYA